MSHKAINFSNIQLRLAAAAAAFAALTLAVFTFVWCFANTASSNAEFKEVGDLLAWMSPSDPQTHFAAGSLHEQALESGDTDAALREYEIAASLAPHNYLLWLRLASARGREGDIAGTEAALRRAEDLAPHYSRVQWALGNFLLREGRDEEAYAKLRDAVTGDPTLAPLAASTALQMADGDADAVLRNFHNSPQIGSSLAFALARQKEYDKAVAIWNAVEPQTDDAYREAAKQIRTALVDGKKFHAAASMKGPSDIVGTAEFEKLTNPGFEQPIKTQGADAFDWNVTQGTYPQVGVTDSQKLKGNYGLIAFLTGQDQKDFRGISQIVAVRPGGSYTLSVPFRSDVRSNATFHWEVLSANDQKRIAISQPMTATQNWTTASIPFSVPQDSDGIVVRFVRGDCAGSACSASGGFWFDELSLVSK
jgi:tetratricopeptide (TPR) repeat protein